MLLRVIDRHDALTSDCKARLPDKPGKRFILTGDCRDLCQRFLGVHRTRKHLQGIARCASRSFYAAPQCHCVRACAPQTEQLMQKRLRQHNCGCRAVSGVGVRFLRCLSQKLRTGILQRVRQDDRFRDACAVVRDEHWCAASRAVRELRPLCVPLLIQCHISSFWAKRDFDGVRELICAAQQFPTRF